MPVLLFACRSVGSFCCIPFLAPFAPQENSRPPKQISTQNAAMGTVLDISRIEKELQQINQQRSEVSRCHPVPAHLLLLLSDAAAEAP
jgi:hypothetical protein